VDVVASLSQGRTAATQCDLFTHKSVPVIFESPCIIKEIKDNDDHFRSEVPPILKFCKYQGIFLGS